MNRSLEDLKSVSADRVRVVSSSLFDLSHRIHATPELAFAEHTAVAAIAQTLERFDLASSRPAYGMDTAIEATIGSGSRTVAVLAEFDALPGLGHACGHNIIAAAAVGAIAGLIGVIDELDIAVRLLGCPAEEGGGGKIRLIEAGAFEDVDAALMVHPGPVDLAFMPTLATARFWVTFTGVAAHASAFPERGVSAGDAATISQVAVGLLRQHLPHRSRVHGIITNGGDAPNVVPAHVELDYMVRAADRESLEQLERRVKACFEAGSRATGASLEVTSSMPRYDELRPDPELTIAFQANAESLGRAFRTIDDRVLRAAGSTDMGNVSQVTRAIHPMIGLGRDAGTIHSPSFADAARSSAGDRAVLDGAIALAATVIDFAVNP